MEGIEVGYYRNYFFFIFSFISVDGGIVVVPDISFKLSKIGCLVASFPENFNESASGFIVIVYGRGDSFKTYKL